jgi:transglutaminase-like putative cysteine protease
VTQEHTPRAVSPGTIRVVPIPGWVEHAPYRPLTLESEDACVANGICRLLYDCQFELSRPDFGRHYRTVQRVLTRAGAERVAHFITDFDPAYERLEINFIRIVRRQEYIEHAKPDAIQTFRRETELERLVLNGRLTASLLIPDVRVDDIVEIAVTVYGSNPVLAGKVSAWTAFDAFSPWLECRYRMLRPVEREVFIKAFNAPPEPGTLERDGIEISQWSLVGQRRREPEDFTPPWAILSPTLQFSEFRNWNEVARLFAPLYENIEVPAALALEVDRLAAEHQEPAERAAKWLQFVQHELRYFALSFGEGSLAPRGLDAIWTSRFGDCKDAAMLYIAGARRMGLDVCAALVSTTLGLTLDHFLPAAALFNHCIVRLRLNGLSYWLDPTTPMQSGSLENIVQPHAGWALPLTLDTERPEKMGHDTPFHLLNLQEDVQFGARRDTPAKLRRRFEYFFGAADTMRHHLANEGTAEYAKRILKTLQGPWPGIVETAPVEIRDDQEKNSVTATFAYEIHDCWKAIEGGRLRFEIVDPVVAGELGALPRTQRQTDIYLGRPRKITRHVRMEMPYGWDGEGWDRVCEAPGLRHTDRLNLSKRQITSAKELVIDTWSIPAANAEDYNRVASELRDNLLTIWARERFRKIRPPTGGQLISAASAWWIFIAVWSLVILAKMIPR